MAARHVDDDARRALLVARQHLGRTAPDVTSMVGDLVAVHSSDPLTPHLAAWARVPGYATSDLDAALHDDRALWRLHGMRRTLFVVPTDAAGDVLAGACTRYAPRERARLEGWLADELGDDADPTSWLAARRDEVLAVLADAEAPVLTRHLSQLVPALATDVTLGSGRWSQRTSVASKALTLFALEGDLVRAAPAGSWRSSQYAWAATAAWFGDRPTPPDEATARAALTARYLARHGPATATDLQWWAGWTGAQARAALAAVDAVDVTLDGGGTGHLLPDDAVAAVDATPGGDASTVALLPGLDPTAMGWKERGFYLDGDGGPLVDRNGNIGPTVWVGGRVVGGWAQRDDGRVEVQLLVDVGSEAAAAVDERAAALRHWLDGAVVRSRFPSPLERTLSG